MAIEVTRAAPVSAKSEQDPDSLKNLPRSLRQQIARSDDLQAALIAQEGQGAPEDRTQEASPPATPEVPATPVSPTAGAQPVPDGQPPVPPQEPNGQVVLTAEELHRLRTLEGRYRSDVQRLSERNDQLQRELMTRPTIVAQPATPDTPLLTPEEISDYGPDFIDVVQRAAVQATRPLLRKIGELEAQVGTVGQAAAVSASERMHQFMDSRLPGWEQINTSAEYVAWSRLPDIYSGAMRQTLMQDAWNRGDGPRVEAFFRGFLAEQAALDPRYVRPAPAPGQVPQPNGSAQPQQPRVTLESLAAPGRARSAPPVPAEKPVYSTAQITKFYQDVATGRFKGTEQDRAAIDADIIAAQFDGRIVLDQRRPPNAPGGFTR